MTDDTVETKPASKGGGVGCVAMAALFLLVGLGGLTFVGLRAWRDMRVFTVWQPTTCTVLDATIGSSRGTRGKPAYRPEITYRYEAGGREYQCTGWDAWAVWGDYGGGSHAYYERVLDRYPVGGAFPCWFDPAEPSHAVLVRRIRPLYMLAALPLAFTVLGAVGLFAAVAKPSHPETGADPTASAGTLPQRPWLEQRLAIRLEADSGPAGQSCGATVIATGLLFVAAIAGYAAWGEWQDGRVPAFMLLFVLLFGGLGLVFLWVSVAAALAARVPRAIVELDGRSLRPGETARVLVRQPGPVRMRSITLGLLGEELTPRPRSSPDIRVIHDRVVAQCGAGTAGAALPIELEADLHVPGDAPPTAAGPPEIRWRLRVLGVPSAWPRYQLTFPLTIEASEQD